MKYLLGNWKMHGSQALVERLGTSLCALQTTHTVGICPPAPYLSAARRATRNSALGPRLLVGAQDLSAHETGAYTGEVSAAMLADLGARFSLIGHSERRQYHREDDAEIAQKVVRAQTVGLMAVVCVGESLAEREAGQAETVIARQLAAVCQVSRWEHIDALPALCIAYEPLWAIGTGRTAAVAQIAEIHAAIPRIIARSSYAGGAGVNRVPVLYGGSVKADNAAVILSTEGVDGVLVGGASLDAAGFTAIVHAAG